MKALSQNVRGHLTSALGVLSSPQRKRCLICLCGLMWIVKFRSIRMIAGQFGNKDTDGGHPFIRHTPDKTKRITSSPQDVVAAQVRGHALRLVIDDTPCPRQGKKIDGLGWHHGAKGIVELPKVGTVALLISKCHKTPRFFISNDLGLTPRQTRLVYDERFKIEFFHKGIQQFLGLGEMFMRSHHCVQTHWIRVAVAYNLVVLMSPKDKPKNIRRTIDRLRWKIPAQWITRSKFNG